MKLLAILLLAVSAHAATITFSTDLYAPWNGCTGYSIWMQKTNEPDPNHWDWQGQTIGWTNTSMKLPASLPSPCRITVTSDKGQMSNSFKSVVYIYDTNALNQLLPLTAPTNIVITP